MLPAVTIVTPSYNQGAFLERTIASVLGQGYPRLEYMVIDGGSTDNSIEIIRKYAGRLAFWVSEADSGQVEALNKGFRRATGEVVAWLNSDDVLYPGALTAVVRRFAGESVAWVVGNVQTVDDRDNERGVMARRYDDGIASWFGIPEPFMLPQPASFWRRSVFDRVGFLREDMHYAFDYEFWFRMLIHGMRPVLMDDILAGFRVHAQSKSCSQAAGFYRENLRIWEMYRKHCPAGHRAELDARITKEALDLAVGDSETLARDGRSPAAVGRLLAEAVQRAGIWRRRDFYGALARCLAPGRKTVGRGRGAGGAVATGAGRN